MSLKKKLLVISICLFTSLLCSCVSDGPSLKIEIEEANPWNHLYLKEDSETFRFAIVSDRTAIPTPGIFSDALKKLDLLQPDFVMSVGDLVEGYNFDGRITDLDKIDDDWSHVTRLVDNLEMPFFYTVGNNDINSRDATSLWEKHFGQRTYYHFTFKDALFVVLNSDDPPGSLDGGISDQQLEWLKEVVTDNNDVRWTFVFMHRPNWHSVAEHFPHPTKTSVFAGHVTSYKKEVRNGITFYTISKTGSFSSGQVPPGDEFDHIMWVTMTKNGPIVANLMLGGIWSDDPG